MAAAALDWTDFSTDENARRGLIDRLDPCVVTDGKGRAIFDAGQWGFLSDPCPPTVHQSLWRHARLLAVHGLFEVVPGVYQVRGLDGANMTLVEGESGVIVIDPLTCVETAAAALALYRRSRGEREVAAVVYTHSHADHFGGAAGVIGRQAAADGRVPVIAPDGFLEEAVGEHIFAGTAMARRAAFQAGTALEAGPEGTAGFGLAMAMATGTISLIPPNVSVERTGEEHCLDGIRVVFQLAPDTEAPAEMNLYLPGHRVLLVAENANHTLHNVLTPRGALVRDAHAWAASLTEVLQLFGDTAEVLIGSHFWPTWGSAALQRMLSEQRDAYAYIHDQTVRLMNQGLTGAEIAEELAELPGDLGRAWHLRGYYGSLSNNIKAVYQRYMGWYDGNPAHLWQYPPAEAGRRYIACMGGADAVVALAKGYVDDGDLRFAVELLNHVVFAEPDHHDARELQAQAFERLAFGAENAVWRNIYLTGARELRGQSTRPRNPGRGEGKLALTAGMTVGQLFQLLTLRLDGPRAAAHRHLSRWNLTDVAETWSLLLANGVLTPVEGEMRGCGMPDVDVALTRGELEQVLAGRRTIQDALADGAVTASGDPVVLTTLFALLEAPRPGFNVATP
jgi:alkyl sulfatase BDS1-like metallo-beta-lactamase superfamily hydrolase